MSHPAFKVTACMHSELNKYTPVFNTNEFEYKLLVYLNPDICRNFEVYKVSKVVEGEDKELPINGFIERENSCWLSILSEILSKQPGQHIYKISLVDKRTSDTCSVYFSYVAQNDSPNKPYVYMRNVDAPSTSHNCRCCNISSCQYSQV